MLDSIRTRIASSVRFDTWWAPDFPRGNTTTSPSRSTRSPSGVRSVGAPRTTISHSSFAWWRWYGQSRSPDSSSYRLPPINSAPSLAPTQASLLLHPSRSSTRSHSSALRLKGSMPASLVREPAKRELHERLFGAPDVVLAVRELSQHPPGQDLLQSPIDDPARGPRIEVASERSFRLSFLDHVLHDGERLADLSDPALDLAAASDFPDHHGHEGRVVAPRPQQDLRDPCELVRRRLARLFDGAEACEELTPVLQEDRLQDVFLRREVVV